MSKQSKSINNEKEAYCTDGGLLIIVLVHCFAKIAGLQEKPAFTTEF